MGVIAKRSSMTFFSDGKDIIAIEVRIVWQKKLSHSRTLLHVDSFNKPD